MQIKCINDSMATPYLKRGQIYTIDPKKDIVRPYKDGGDFYVINHNNYNSKRFVEVQSNANG